MVIEVLMLVAAATIFVIVARRFPATSQETDKSLLATSQGSDSFWGGAEKQASRLRLIRFQKMKDIIWGIKGNVKLPRWFGRNKQSIPAPAQPAIRFHSQARATAENRGETVLQEADYWFEKHNFNKAEGLYLKAALHYPKETKIYSRLGVIYLDRKNYKDAQEALMTAIRFDPDIASRHYNLALAHAGLNDRKNGLVAIRKALDLDPQNKKYLKLLEKLAQ